MNQYATVAEYNEIFPDDTVNDLQLQLASDKIDTVTFFRIRPNRLTDFQSERVKLATIYQTQFMAHSGSQSEQGKVPPIKSYNSLDLSVTYADESEHERYLRVNGITQSVYDFLNPTGLLTRIT